MIEHRERQEISKGTSTRFKIKETKTKTIPASLVLHTADMKKQFVSIFIKTYARVWHCGVKC